MEAVFSPQKRQPGVVVRSTNERVLTFVLVWFLIQFESCSLCVAQGTCGLNAEVLAWGLGGWGSCLGSAHGLPRDVPSWYSGSRICSRVSRAFRACWRPFESG